MADKSKENNEAFEMVFGFVRQVNPELVLKIEGNARIFRRSINENSRKLSAQLY